MHRTAAVAVVALGMAIGSLGAAPAGSAYAADPDQPTNLRGSSTAIQTGNVTLNQGGTAAGGAAQRNTPTLNPAGNNSAGNITCVRPPCTQGNSNTSTGGATNTGNTGSTGNTGNTGNQNGTGNAGTGGNQNATGNGGTTGSQNGTGNAGTGGNQGVTGNAASNQNNSGNARNGGNAAIASQQGNSLWHVHGNHLVDVNHHLYHHFVPLWAVVPVDFHYFFGPMYVYDYFWYFHRHILFPHLYIVFPYEPIFECDTYYYFFEGFFYCRIPAPLF
jgi:hypothetical protein